MKNTKRFMFTLLVAVVSLCANAQTTISVDGLWYDIYGDGHAEVARNANVAGDIVIPATISYNGQSYNVTALVGDAFKDCKDITSVSLPDGLESIGGSAFQYNGKLASINLPNSVTYVGYDAFYDCLALETPVYNNTIFAFLPTSYEGEYSIPEGITTIVGHAFWSCNKMTAINIPSSVKSIGKGAFSGCESITSLVIPGTVEDLETAWTFSGCISLTTFELPEIIDEVQELAFWGCGVVSVVIPSSVKSFGDEVFLYNSSIKSLCFKGTVPPTCTEKTFESIDISALTLYVPAEAVEDYKKADVWKDFGSIRAAVCEAPVITLESGKIVVSTTTEDAKCYTTITSDDINTFDGAGEIELNGVYTITSYAYKSGFANSGITTATLVWTNPESENDGVMSMEMKKTIILRSAGNAIVVNGLESGEKLALYNTTGMLLDNITASGNEATIGHGLQTGQIYIVKVGQKSIKFKM